MSGLYAALTRLRRHWYTQHPQRRRRLPRPVISVGNLVVGGSGKTPVVAHLAEWLREAGERPAVLSRGYGRRHCRPDLCIVSDGTSVLADVERSGDEPQLLARILPGVPVLVAADRYEAGRVAIERLGCTALVLDDGFQHLRLARDVDLLLVSPGDLEERVLPAGRLREPLTAARHADALLVSGSAPDPATVARALHVAQAFTIVARYGTLRTPAGHPLAPAPGARVLAVAGIARPWRFFAALRDHGWTVVGERVYPDHHWFTPRECQAIEATARQADAEVIVTTEKDAMRFARVAGWPGVATDGPRWAVLPMRAAVEPPAAFTSWLSARLAQWRP